MEAPVSPVTSRSRHPLKTTRAPAGPSAMVAGEDHVIIQPDGLSPLQETGSRPLNNRSILPLLQGEVETIPGLRLILTVTSLRSNPMLPRARTEDLIVEALPTETLVYDTRTHLAHCLNLSAATVWKHCDGIRGV